SKPIKATNWFIGFFQFAQDLLKHIFRTLISRRNPWVCCGQLEELGVYIDLDPETCNLPKSDMTNEEKILDMKRHARHSVPSEFTTRMRLQQLSNLKDWHGYASGRCELNSREFGITNEDWERNAEEALFELWDKQAGSYTVDSIEQSRYQDTTEQLSRDICSQWSLGLFKL
ncbi:hypothetical protein BGZ49_008213, partial [Haplosporangium sp. Z 27]